MVDRSTAVISAGTFISRTFCTDSGNDDLVLLTVCTLWTVGDDTVGMLPAADDGDDLALLTGRPAAESSTNQWDTLLSSILAKTSTGMRWKFSC